MKRWSEIGRPLLTVQGQQKKQESLNGFFTNKWMKKNKKMYKQGKNFGLCFKKLKKMKTNKIQSRKKHSLELNKLWGLKPK